MRELLEAVAAGELSPEAAEAQLRGYTTTDAGRFDAAREARSGVPEAVLASGKTSDEVATLVEASLETTGRALATRLDDADVEAIRARIADSFPEASLDVRKRARAMAIHSSAYDAPNLDATVGIVTAGTSDAVPAGEAQLVIEEMGPTVTTVDDVGVASLDRLLDSLETLRAQDILIVAAGREGALPTVVAGLVDIPVIALPVSTGYGYGRNGEAALMGMLQSCTALSVVNIDAGFTAGVQAGLIARKLHEVRTE